MQLTNLFNNFLKLTHLAKQPIQFLLRNFIVLGVPRIDVGTTAMLVTEGEALRLEISSSEHPTYDANTNTGASSLDADALDGLPATQSVYHDALRPSRLIVRCARFGSAPDRSRLSDR